MNEKLAQFERLLNIMDVLRDKCPWDKKQTIESLRHLTIEETYELCDAIINDDLEGLKGEIGDLILHMVFYSKIASERKAFDIGDVLENICDKLIHRHPHIYGDVKAETEEDVKANWEQLKLEEGTTSGKKKSVLSGVPKSMPSLVKAVRIQDKVKGVGFDWDNKEQVWEKVQEELQEFKNELDAKNSVNMEQEFGDLIFSIVNYARFVGVNPEDALEKTNNKFVNRFKKMESSIYQEGKDLKQMSLNEMNHYWDEAKRS